ncbi:hypothetical protein [Aquabacterium humicola]|uniref:hypothetical protein n=1 Tax=Aquabacterium humicola TaxID=3237377 RepID=UPI0025430182|nr:hypothetical protein [Rubrivivax pictus]
MAAYPSTSPLPITSNVDVEATINGYRWIFVPGTSRVLNWSVSGSAWSHPSLQSAETQEDFKTLFDFISYYINASFNFLGHFSSTQATPGYRAAYAAGSNLNITFGYGGFNSAGQFINDNQFVNVDQTAHCFFPATSFDASQYAGAAGDTWLNWNNPFIRSLDFEVGSNGFALLLHEVLHGLGLKHPHDDGGTGRPTYTDLQIPYADRQWISVMSYDKFENGGDGAYDGSMPIAPMIMDVIALQYLYGESAGSAGNTTVDISKYLGLYYNTLWDASGLDTLDASNQAYGLAVDMGTVTAFNGTNVHHAGFITTAVDALSLAVFGFNPSRWTWLWGEYENFIGSAYADTVEGNDLDNELNGGPGDDVLEGGAGNDTFDWNPSKRAGADLFRGGLGNDRYVIDSPLDRIEEFDYEGVDTVFVGFDYSLQGTALENLSAFNDMLVGVRFTGNTWGNELTGGARADTLLGLEGNDRLTGLGGNDTIDGGIGIDTAVFSGVRSGYAVTRDGSAWRARALTGADGSDLLYGIERLSFTNTSLALDTQAGGNGYLAAIVIRALEGPEHLRDGAEVGAALSLLDSGTSLANLVALTVGSSNFAQMAGSRSNTDFVKFVYENVVGFAPGPGDLSYYVGLLDSRQFTQASLGLLAVTVDVNTQSLDIVGLAQTGIAFDLFTG